MIVFVFIQSIWSQIFFCIATNSLTDFALYQLPTLAFTVTDEPKRLKDIVCFSTIAEEKLRINRNGARFEISQAKPFTPGYARISCTVPEAEGRFRWFGYQYYITR